MQEERQGKYTLIHATDLDTGMTTTLCVYIPEYGFFFKHEDTALLNALVRVLEDEEDDDLSDRMGTDKVQ